FNYGNLGLLQLRKGDRSAAEQAFRRAVDVDPKSIPARLSLGNFYWAAGDRAGAEREMKAALALDPKSPDANRTLAAFYSISGPAADAEPYLKTFAAVSTNVDPKLALADFYLSAGRAKEAVAVLEPLSNDPAAFGAAKLRLASVAFHDGRR